MYIKQSQKLTVVSTVLLVSMLLMLVFPITVLADDATPPPVETPEVLPPTEEPVTLEETGTLMVSTPTEVPATEIPATEVPATEESVTESVPDGTVPINEELGVVDLAEIVQTASENNLMLADPSGSALGLGTVEASQSLTNGDPYFTSGGVLYAFTFADCDPLTAGDQPCSTPIQAALTLAETFLPDLLIAPDGALRRTIYVEPATYNEQLTINTGDLTLWGDPGDMIVPGAAASAPVLDGSTWASGDTGVTINAEGVTLIGFIIQNYDRAVSQPIVVGSNTVVITQNTIQDNGEGIVILSDQGSPGTDVTYNIFQDNSSHDLVNGAPDDNNVQFVDAPNNYWGCASGPVVAYRIFTGSGQNKVWTGQWGYIDWATKYDYGVNGVGNDPDPACAVLYGSDSLFDFQINTDAYSPYKINIGSFFAQAGTPAIALVKIGSPAVYDSVGDIINYSYLVTNTGNVTLSGPFSVDDDKTIVTCPAGGLAPSDSITCTASYTITQADLDSGSVTNTARASANGNDSNQDSVTVTAIQNPALTIVKTAAPITYTSVGQVINYSFLVTNTGNVTLTGPFVVSDDKSADESCPITLSLAPGASITCTASYTITQGDLNAGSVTNTAFVTNGSVTSPTDSETVTALQTPALSLVKTATPTTYSAVGQTINYSYLVTNTGNVTLPGPISVSDNKAAVSCPAGGLAPGASMTCTASYTITQADLNAGSVTNIAQAFSNGTHSNQDSETVTAVQSSALTIVKTATPTTYSAVGQTINYSYLVTNTGNVALSGPFTVTDDKVTVTCPAGGLAPGASMTCTASYTITQADLNAGSVTNIAFATNGTVTSPTDTETVTAVQSSALSIVKTAAPTTYSVVGQTINYSYLVTNTGNVTLTGPFIVSDDKSADENCPITLSLAPGGSITCTASYTITQADINAGSVTNIAFVTNGAVTSPTDSETVTAVQNSGLTIVKTASPTTYSAVGQTINYSYLVTNTGNVALSGPFTVTDDKAAVTCPAGGLAPGASITCTASYTITQADINAGTVTNIAFATNGTVSSPTDSETVNAIQNPALTIVKTASPTTYSAVGQTINYSYLVTNTGNVTLGGPFTVTDDKAAVTCPAGGLAPGVSITCTASYTITQADLNAGSVTNIAFATNGTVTSQNDTETVTAVQNTGLTIVKTASPGTFDSIGDVINYTYLVTNTGNVTLSGPFTVTDDKAAVTCPAGGLAPGVSITCTASYTITQADLNAGSVTNIAFATNGTVTSPTDTETVTAIRNPSLTTAKTVTSNGPYIVGDTITYTIVVTNTGNVILTGVTVTDNNAVMGTCNPVQPSTLAPGASMTCSASHVVTQADVNSGSYVNTATGDSDQTAPTTSSVRVNFNRIVNPTPPANSIPVLPSVSFTGFIPVTGGETHAIAAGIAHTCAIMPEGGVQCWGNNDFGQLGDGTNTGSNIPVDVVRLGGGTTIVAGGNHTCVLSGGDVWCWGQNSQGQLGDGTRTNRNVPVRVLGNVVDLTAGLDYTCAVMVYGQVMCWGNNDQGQLADGTRIDRTTPTLAALISNIANVDAGRNQSCGLTGTGLLRCLSEGNAQDLGGLIPATGQSPEISLDVAVNRFGNLVMALIEDGVPVEYHGGQFEAITDVTHAIDVDSGLGHVCALVADGTVSCWGSNYYGQLGRNTNVSSQVPQSVLNVSGAWQLAVGRNHACVLITSGTPGTNDIQCWGLNSNGQLGNGTYVNSAIPVFVK